MTEQFTQPLNPSISQLANFFTVKSFPPLTIKLLKKLNNNDWTNKVDKRIANVALVLIENYFEVYW